MKFRKLEKWEHEKTRALYELVFSEDEQSFVDYYYETRAKENQIYGAEDGEGIHGMLHLNPCQVIWNGETLVIWYVVAVATEPDYRHKGLMRRLLTRALEDLRQQGSPFVFLMPASEAIYTPFGFRRAWDWQWEEEALLGRWPGGTGFWGSSVKKEGWRKADREILEDEEMLEGLAEGVNRELAAQFQLFSRRSPKYYRRLAKEQEASGGGLEFLFGERSAGEKEVLPLCARCRAKETFPPMMARITNLESFIARVRTKEPVTRIWQVTDELLPQNQGLFEITFTPRGGQLRRMELLAAESDRIEKVDIAELPDRLGEDCPFRHAMVCEVV